MSSDQWEIAEDEQKCDKTADEKHEYGNIYDCSFSDWAYSVIQCQPCMLVCVKSTCLITLEPKLERFYKIGRCLEVNEQPPSWVLYGKDPPTC